METKNSEQTDLETFLIGATPGFIIALYVLLICKI